MDLSAAFFLVAAIAVLITGISKSGFGGGLGVMSVPLMSLFIAPQFAAAILMPILLVMDIIIVWQYRARWSRPVVALLLPGALLGLAVGALMFQAMNADVIRFLVGILALFFVAQYVLRQRKVQQPQQAVAPLVFSLGAISGFASFIAHAGGPPVKGFLLRQKLEKSVFVGTNTMFFFSMNAIKTVAYGAMGQLTAESMKVSLLLSPMLVLGIGLGTLLHRFVDQNIFTKIVYGFLFLTGLRLLWDGAASAIL